MPDNETKTPTFAAEFPPATREDWRRLVDGVLKGAPFERLISTTYDGLRIEPLAERRSTARPVAGRAPQAPWQVLSRIDHPDPALANAAALDDLANGADGLALVFAGAVGDYGGGLPPTEEALARALAGVDLSATTIELVLSPQAEAVIDAALAKGIILPPRSADLRLGHDPLGAMALTGAAYRPWSEAAPHFARRLAALMREGFSGRLAVAEGRLIHNAGGSEAQELAFALAVALAYLRALEAEGIALAPARTMLFFRLTADAEQFLTIAKFRALRKLWARVETACGLDPEPAFVSAETAWRMMARRDPHVNILRATIAVFAAALGGADAIAVLPFSAASGLPGPFARRIARNTQLILLEEAHLDKVADPAAGSGAIEDLSDQLCRAAWALFQEIEAAGGAAAALTSGLLQQKVAAVAAKRAAAIARRQDALTGVSIYPNLDEAAVVGQNTSPPPLRGRSIADATGGDPEAGASKDATPLPGAAAARLRPLRLAEPFEALRDASDRALATTGVRPKIFLATLGTPAEFTPRATFAKNFFEAGGIEAVSSDGIESPSSLVDAYERSGATLVCLCSTDKVYATEAAAAAEGVKAAGARHVYLAGRPGGGEGGLRAAGVQSFIYEGCDALATLKGAYDILGIKVA